MSLLLNNLNAIRMNFKKMSIISIIFSIVSLVAIQCSSNSEDTIALPPTSPEELEVSFYLSTYDGIAKLNQQDKTFTQVTENSNSTIKIENSEVYQTMDGFGFTLTGGSAMHLYNMSSSKRLALLNELFATDEDNIGVSY